MSLVHCHNCKKDFVCTTVINSANNIDIKCEHCHSTCIEILAEDEFMRSINTVNTDKIVSILRQEYDNIMNMVCIIHFYFVNQDMVLFCHKLNCQFFFQISRFGNY